MLLSETGAEYRLFYKLNNFCKYIRICNCKIWKNLSIESNTLCIHSMDKCRISHPIETSCVIETNCPKTTELPFLLFTPNVCIWSSFHDSCFCARIYIPVHSTISFCKSKDIFMSFMGHYTAFYSSHNLKEL
jgi:hypothetical protein